MSETTTTGAAGGAGGAGGKTAGEVVTWNVVRVKVPFAQVRAALRAAGLEETLCPDMVKRNAFRRAAQKLKRDRIIRVVAEDCDYLTFQYTAESMDAASHTYRYDLEAVLTLDKTTGQVSSKDAALAAQAQAQIDDEVAHRTGGDLTAIVQRLFRRNADLFPIRDQGGVYFVPGLHAKFTQQVDTFLLAVTGKRLGRFPVKAGTPHGDASVNKAVAEGLGQMVEELTEAVAAFGEDTSPSRLERAAQRIQQQKFKAEAYAEFLAGQKEQLDARLAEAEQLLRQKVEAVMAAQDAEAVAA